MITCPFCDKEFKRVYPKWTEEKKRQRRFQPAWLKAKDIFTDYNNGYAIRWLVRKYGADKRTIRKILTENGVKKFRGRKGIQAWNKGKSNPHSLGSKNVNWKGGVTPLNMKVRRCPRYKFWVGEIMKRDNFTCKLCQKGGGDLEVDHYPVMFRDIMVQISSFEEALESQILWDTNNGRTLCKNCHNKTKSSFNKLK